MTVHCETCRCDMPRRSTTPKLYPVLLALVCPEHDVLSGPTTLLSLHHQQQWERTNKQKHVDAGCHQELSTLAAE